MTARRRARGCGRPDSNRGSPPCPARSDGNQEGALSDYKSDAMPGYATAARLDRGGPSASSRPSCRPPASPRPPTGMAPPGFEPGTRNSRSRRIDRFPTGLSGRAQNTGRETAGDGVAQRPKDPKPTAPGTRAQRIMAALPSSNAASRCGDAHCPNGFHDAVRIMQTEPRGPGVYGSFGARLSRRTSRPARGGRPPPGRTCTGIYSRVRCGRSAP